MVEPVEVQRFFQNRSLTDLRYRAAVVSEVVGFPPKTRGPWARYVWENGGGDATVWFFQEDGRALLLTIDHESKLNLYSDGDGQGQFDLYRGISEDMLDLVIGHEDDEPLLTLEHNETRVVFATGVFWFDGREWLLSEGLRDRIASDERLKLRDTGIRFCLAPYELATDYAPGEFEYHRI